VFECGRRFTFKSTAEIHREYGRQSGSCQLRLKWKAICTRSHPALSLTIILLQWLQSSLELRIPGRWSWEPAEEAKANMVWTRFHFALAAVYLAGLIVVGILTGRKARDSNQFLNATGALPLWVCMTACIAANCGSLDVTAMMALGAQYGILAAHFYWIGAIPALVVLTFWLLPAYAKGRYPSILEFIDRHYGAETRALVALCMATIMLLLSGVCLCAAAQVFVTFLGWSFLEGILLTTPLVLLYTWSGGFRATIYTELLHFALVLVAVVPLSFVLICNFGGFWNLLRSVPSDRLHAWQTLPFFAPHATMDRFGVIFGLGMVLSFGYWSTDFVLMQRALAVRRGAEVRLVPLGLAASKLVFSFLIVFPGIVAPIVLQSKAPGNWNATLPSLILRCYSPFWAVIGIMGLATSLVATFANNISGFSAAWVLGIYRPTFRPDRNERHYVSMGRLATAAAILLSIGGAYVALEYQSIMEYMQMIFSTFNGPIFALVMLAALVPARAAGGGLGGFISGLVCAISHQVLAHAHVFRYGSQMNANFYGAVLGFGVAVVGTLVIGHSRRVAPAPESEARERDCLSRKFPPALVLLAGITLCVCVALNVYFW
jgi:SSS family solute:Na+ symporter